MPFYVGKPARGRVRILEVDPVSGERVPQAGLTDVVIRFRRPDGTVLAEHTIASGVTDAGEGLYYATSKPDMEGLWEIEFEGGGEEGGGDSVKFAVEPL